MMMSDPNAIIDTRVLGKPSQFHGKDKDFPEFKHGLIAYLGCLSPDLPEMMEQSAAQANPIEVTRLNDAASKLTKQLYFVLSMLCKGKALRILKKVEKQQHGLEGWRLLMRRF